MNTNRTTAVAAKHVRRWPIAYYSPFEWVTCLFVLVILTAASWVAADDAVGQVITVQSPDGDIVVQLQPAADMKGSPHYRITHRGKVVVQDSPLGLSFSEGGALAGLDIVKVSHDTRNETYQVVAGKSATARNHYKEATVLLRERDEPSRQVEIVLRAYDDGAAFRYNVPEQPAFSGGEMAITSEDSHFVVPEDATAWALPLWSFNTHHENYYETKRIGDFKLDQLYGLPLLLQVPDGPWIAITEANLTDYAGMYLKRAGKESADDKGGSLVSTLSPLPGQERLKVKATTPHASPWRVLMIGESPGDLIESNLVLNLSEPCAIVDTSWITPGKVSFLWWNGYVALNQDFEGGMNTATIKHYIDFAAEHGFEYASLDGFDHAWYGGHNYRYEGADITTAAPEVDLPEILAYAKEKGVRMRLWMNWKGLQKHMDKALPLYEEWGVEGIMVDFIERDDQEMINWIHNLVKKAAEHHLTVGFHNIHKPTGLRRTYPNLMNYESVLNLEYNKWSGNKPGSTPDHELIVPFVRMLAGPLDYHSGGFRSVPLEEYEPQNIGPVVMGTRAHQMAMYLVYENPLPMICDYPAAYAGEVGVDFLADVPTTWDETRFVDGQIGDFITIARRKGTHWYVGSMGDQEPRRLEIPLDFLGDGEFVAKTWSDGDHEEPNAVKRGRRQVIASDTISAIMGPAGGHVIHLFPASDAKAE